MSKAKRSISWLLALTMCLTLCAGAWASEEPEVLSDIEASLSTEDEETADEVSVDEETGDPSAEWAGYHEGAEEPVDEIVPVPLQDGSAASGTCGENLNWSLSDDGSMTISGTGAMTEYSWNFPWENLRDSIVNVTIEDGVTSIAESAFRGCSALTNITIPNSVNSIGAEAFEASGLIHITIPEGVTELKTGTFDKCHALTSISLPNSLLAIGYYVFQDCRSLVALNIPANVMYISPGLFGQAEEERGAGYTSSDSYKLSVLTVDEKNQTYHSAGNCIINTESRELVVGCSKSAIPDDGSVTRIGSYAFSYNTELEEITIPDSITEIGAGSFFGCSNLKHIVIPDSVTAIYRWAFSYCDSLEQVTIPGNITTFNSPFIHCKNLKSVVFTDGLTEIGGFADCPNLKSVTIPGSVTRIDDNAFSGCASLEDLFIPDSVLDIGASAFDGTPFIAGHTEKYVVLGSCLYAYNGSDEHVVVPEGVKGIRSKLFGDDFFLPGPIENDANTEIKTVVLPEGLISIGYSAFAGCIGLESVTIPSSVSYIGRWAFKNTPFIESQTQEFVILGSCLYKYNGDSENVVIPKGIKQICCDAFEGCSALQNLTIPEGVVRIGSAFYTCSSLKNVYLPASLKIIEESAFFYYADYYYAGTAQEWDQISIGNYNNALNGTRLHFVEHNEYDYDNDGSITVIDAANNLKSTDGAFHAATVLKHLVGLIEIET